MRDSPPADELLDAVARTLSEQVLPQTAGATAHAVRVAASLCRLVAREIDAPDGAATDHGLAALLELGLERLGEVDLAGALDDRLQSDDPAFDEAVADLLFADVCRRVDIAKPDYRRVGG